MNNDIESIIKAIKEEKISHAEILSWDAIKNNGETTELLQLLGFVLSAQGKYAGSIQAYLKLIALQKNNFNVIIQIFQL